jgi:hypothetical protein
VTQHRPISATFGALSEQGHTACCACPSLARGSAPFALAACIPPLTCCTAARTLKSPVNLPDSRFASAPCLVITVLCAAAVT